MLIHCMLIQIGSNIKPHLLDLRTPHEDTSKFPREMFHVKHLLIFVSKWS